MEPMRHLFLRPALLATAVLVAACSGCGGPKGSPEPAKPANGPPPAPGGAETIDEKRWPRAKTLDDGTEVVIHPPQVDAWEDHLRLQARVAVSVKPAGAVEPFFGALRLEADTWADLDERTVTLYRPRILAARFPTLPEAEAQHWQKRLDETLPVRPLVAELDFIVANLEATGTTLLYIVNCNAAIARSGDDHYFLVSGRWFKGRDLGGPWVATPGSSLPPEFLKIPKDHVMGFVRASVPGTPEAAEAVTLASVPTQATVSREATITVTYYGGEPEFHPVEGTSLAYAVNTSYDVIRSGSLYYCCYQGVWFVSTKPTGPWVVADKVVAEVYTIPASCPVHHVTYVHVYESTPTVVVVGYTPAYTGVYVSSSGTVVYGTGYYYPCYVYTGPAYAYPVYCAYPVSYGGAAYYNPYTGTYANGVYAQGWYGGAGKAYAYSPATGATAWGGYAYGPNGSAGYAAAYNPTTGTYARAGTVTTQYGTTSAARAYNPRTGAYAGTNQSSNPYAQWGESVAGRGDDWVHTAHYTDSRGTAAAFETSQGGKGAGARTDQGSGFVYQAPSGDVYAGKDGNVYKQDGSACP